MVFVCDFHHRVGCFRRLSIPPFRPLRGRLDERLLGDSGLYVSMHECTIALAELQHEEDISTLRPEWTSVSSRESTEGLYFGAHRKLLLLLRR
jgi:2-iminoacetate synthase ThiH